MKSITIEGQLRTEAGKKSAKTLRKDEQVPCVLYGGENPISFSAPMASLRSLIYTPEFNVINLSVDGKGFKATLKDIQYHPVTDSVLHVDFLELVEDKKVTLELPLIVIGTAKGVKEGGRLLQKVRRLKVRAFPKNLKDYIEVNVENLGLGKSVRVSDITAEGMEILNAASTPVASVEVPRAMRGKAEEGAEGKAKK